VRHFDTARAYGYGDAERIVGRFAKGRRDQLTIATKVGIPGPARTRLGAALAGVRGARPWPPARFDAAAVCKSVDTSLRALGSDHVDLLLLHEPAVADVQSDELAETLEDLLRQGKTRAIGAGGSVAVARAVIADPRRLDSWIVQVPSSVLQPAVDAAPGLAGAHLVTHSVIAADLAALRRARSDEGWSSGFERSLGVAPTDDVLVSLLLRHALRANPRGVVLFASMRPDRVAAAAAAAAAADEVDLDTFAALVGAAALL
jgi:aryl-alcohol dehydrogenase-like predicted oxidoreductase